MVQVFFAEATLKESARVDSWRSMALEKYLIAEMVAVFAAKEMVESNFVEGGRRCVGGEVTANAWCSGVGAQHHGDSIPSNEGTDPMFYNRVTGIVALGGWIHSVEVGR